MSTDYSPKTCPDCQAEFPKPRTRSQPLKVGGGHSNIAEDIRRAFGDADNMDRRPRLRKSRPVSFAGNAAEWFLFSSNN